MNHIQASASTALRIEYAPPNHTAPHRTATGLWAPGPANATHGIVRRPPQHPNPQLYNIPHFLTKMTATDTLQRNKIVADNIPTSALYTHYLQHAKTLSETELCTQRD